VRKAEADQIFAEELYLLQKKVLVLIPAPWQSILPEHVQLLGKILASVKLSIDGVIVLHYPKIDLDSLLVYNPKCILSFGTALTPPCKTFVVEEVQGIQIIQAEAFESMDDLKKKSLWIALKQAFKL
jgi:hypothetical protein